MGLLSGKLTARKSKPLLLTNIGQLLTLRQPGKSQGARPGSPARPDFGRDGVVRRGPELKQIGLLEDAAVLCAEGKIIAAGCQREILRQYKAGAKRLWSGAQEVDCAGRVALPGFVDAHTHPVFAAPRLVDFEKRIAGASYEEIARSGGGIRSSVEAVRKASRRELASGVASSLREMAAGGTTTVEAKSGYGLSVEAELKSLEAISDAAKDWPGTVVATLLAAHVVPKEFQGKPEKYVGEIVEKMIPQAAKRKLAQFVDVFIERGAFSLTQAEEIFEAGRKHGLGIRAHVCQLSGCELWPLLRFEPVSLDHLDHINDEDIPQLARRNVVATLVPGANYFLGTREFPPARKLVDAGVAVALATDYNPGTSPTASMPFVLSLACTQMKMSPAEAIAAATINGAHALRLADRKGSIEPGKDADLALFDVKDYREIAYWVAANKCWKTVIAGQILEL